MGYLKECSCNSNPNSDGTCSEGCSECGKTKYAIIQLDHDNGRITVYDYCSDIKIDNNVKVRDPVELWITGNYSAVWRPREFKENHPQDMVSKAIHNHEAKQCGN